MIKKRLNILEDKKRKEEIEKIEKEVEDVFYILQQFPAEEYLFEELIEEHKKEQEETFHSSSEEKIDLTSEHVINNTLSTISKTLVGGGIGSLMLIYNPFIGIGTTIAGLAAGYLLSKVKD
jgi:hypothetical protein